MTYIPALTSAIRQKKKGVCGDDMKCQRCGTNGIITDDQQKICIACGQVQEGTMTIDKERESEEVTISKDAKIAIAQEAKQNGIKPTAEKHGLPMGTVRAWVGAYCRKMKEPKSHSSKIESMVENITPVAPDYQRECARLQGYLEGYRRAVQDFIGEKK